MTANTIALKAKEYKSDIKPIWCPGCGHYSILNAITKAMAALQLEKRNVAIISGIGCSSRLPAYTDMYGFHGVHGATGFPVEPSQATVAFREVVGRRAAAFADFDHALLGAECAE